MIERITIQNFKSIDRVSVELSPVTVLVGRSGTGKSNFVQAVRCLRDLLTKGQIPNFAEYRPSFEFSGPTRFDIELRVPGYGKLRYMVAIPMANSPSPRRNCSNTAVLRFFTKRWFQAVGARKLNG